MKLLDGKSVIVTGAGSGVGRAAARLFADEGAKVVCADILEDRSTETVKLIEEDGGTAIPLTVDVVQVDDVNRAIATAVSEFGRLDVMYNNAGIASPRRGMLLEQHTDDEYDRLFAINTRGVFFGCRESIHQFKKQDDGRGVILNTASIAGMVGLGSTVYGATKAAIIQMTRGLAIEAAPFGIRVNCICPGGMSTNFGTAQELVSRQPTKEELELGRKMHPLGLPITPDDCAAAALYLVSDQSKNVTGVALPIDGGYIAR